MRGRCAAGGAREGVQLGESPRDPPMDGPRPEAVRSRPSVAACACSGWRGGTADLFPSLERIPAADLGSSPQGPGRVAG